MLLEKAAFSDMVAKWRSSKEPRLGVSFCSERPRMKGGCGKSATCTHSNPTSANDAASSFSGDLVSVWLQGRWVRNLQTPWGSSKGSVDGKKPGIQMVQNHLTGLSVFEPPKSDEL